MAQAAPTYTPQNAIDLVRKFVRDAPVTSLDSQACDIVNSLMWLAYPWWWAQASLTAIPLVDGTQDYALAAGNNNLHKLLRVRITRTDTTPDQYLELMIRNELPPDLGKTSMRGIQSCAYDGINDKIRLSRALSIPSGETLQIDGEYWKKPTLIADAGLGTAFLFPDRYFPVFVEGLKWKFYEYVGDSRCGTAQTDKSGRRTYTGQLGVFMESLHTMAQNEDYGDEGSEFPDSPIGEASFSGFGIYGA